MRFHWLVTWGGKKLPSEFSPDSTGSMFYRILQNSARYVRSVKRQPQGKRHSHHSFPYRSLKSHSNALLWVWWDPLKPQQKQIHLGDCDYAMRYPKAIPLQSVDAEHIVEEFVKVFLRVGVPKEKLTNQGSNFTSRMLVKVYRLLHIRPIKTSPYHPQTDGLVERFGTSGCPIYSLCTGRCHNHQQNSPYSSSCTVDRFKDPWIYRRRPGR